jgi:hypothetical protein
MLNRFIDKLDTASYGYAGLFDANKVTEVELDQLYAFDQGLMTGVHTLSGDLDTLQAATHADAGSPPAAGTTDLAGAMAKLGTTIDGLLQTWSHRNDVLTTGTPMPSQEFERFRTAQDAQGTPTGRLDTYQAPPLAGNVGTAHPTGSSTGAGMGNAGPGPGPGMGAPGPGMSGPGMGSTGGPGMGGADMSSDPGATQRLNPPPYGQTTPGYDAAVPSGAEGGSLGGGDLGTNRPIVGGADSAGSPAARAGADPDAVTSYEDPNAPAVGPEADDTTHTTMGGQAPTGGSGSGQ